jgi:hypothetical protein
MAGIPTSKLQADLLPSPEWHPQVVSHARTEETEDIRRQRDLRGAKGFSHHCEMQKDCLPAVHGSITTFWACGQMKPPVFLRAETNGLATNLMIVNCEVGQGSLQLWKVCSICLIPILAGFHTQWKVYLMG